MSLELSTIEMPPECNLNRNALLIHDPDKVRKNIDLRQRLVSQTDQAYFKKDIDDSELVKLNKYF